MKPNSELIRTLLQLYPGEWRAQYGAQLVAWLEASPLTASRARDVIVGAIYERWLRRDVWTNCGIFLFILTSLTIFASNTVLSFADFAWWNYKAQELILVSTACWSVMRGDRKSPAWGAVRAGLAGLIPEAIALWVTPWASFAYVSERMSDDVPTKIMIACVLGFCGGLVGRLLRSIAQLNRGARGVQSSDPTHGEDREAGIDQHSLASRLLLRLYPAAWRAEYGEELGALLARGPVTASVLLDVTWSAVVEHFKSPWKVCGVAIFFLTIIGIVANNTVPLSPVAFLWFGRAMQLIAIMAGYFTILRRDPDSPSRAGMKAAMLGIVPELVALALWAAGIFHPLVTRAPGPYPLLESRLAMFDMTFPTAPQPNYWFVAFYLTLAMMGGFLCGFVGGLVGSVSCSLSRIGRVR